MQQKAFVVVLAVVLAALAGAGRAAAAGSKTFMDPSGDGSNAPDITQLVISNDDAGNVSFEFTFANRPTVLTADDVVAIGLDTDSNGATGDAFGYDYVLSFGLQGPRAVLGKATGRTTYDFLVPQKTLRSADGGRTMTINRSELGGAGSFRSRVETSDGAGSSDTAPEGGLAFTWDYALVLRPQVVAMRAGFIPGQPRQAKVFRLGRPTLRLSSGQEVAPAAYSCKATLAGKAIKPTARCRWKLPKKSKGKRLVVVVTATYGGVRSTFDPYRFTVRA